MTRFSPSACGGLRIALSNVEVMLRWSGAMWLEAERTLVVADLHFEKGSSYAARFGQMLPPYDTRETLDRLDREIALLTPDRLVFLGDSFHDGDGEARLAHDDARRLEGLAVGRELVWAVGNHDADGPKMLPGEIIDEAMIAGLTL
ncbi:MAG TPA: metallophosphoesterase, partial [Caulobacter sp.]|nr:metallophosphoesterase [Caulobacter sp.]